MKWNDEMFKHGSTGNASHKFAIKSLKKHAALVLAILFWPWGPKLITFGQFWGKNLIGCQKPRAKIEIKQA